MKLLAIDTVTEMASVALSVNDNLLVEEEFVPQQHTRVILPMIQKLMATAGLSFWQLDAIAFSRGPGSFTGLRICASITQGLAISHELPVIPVSTLAILAQGSFRLEQFSSVVACMDARREEVYWASFVEQDGLMNLVGLESVISPAKASTETGGPWHGVGTGLRSYKAELEGNPAVNLESMQPEQYPLAQDALEFARKAWRDKNYVDAALAIPTYLRDNIATPPENQV